MNIDYDKLRKDLIDYFGTAMITLFPQAVLDINKIERASDDELIKTAIQNGFDLSKYEESKHYRK